MRHAPSADEEWTRFSADLAICLSDLDEDEFLVVASKEVNYFVQFAAQGAFGVRAEAVCNSFIEPLTALLVVEDYKQMAKLGWLRATNAPPNGTDDPEPSDGSPNFYLDAATPVNFNELAKLAVDSLRKVYRIGHPGELQYRAFAKGETQIRFPSLRIKRSSA